MITRQWTRVGRTYPQNLRSKKKKTDPADGYSSCQTSRAARNNSNSSRWTLSNAMVWKPPAEHLEWIPRLRPRRHIWFRRVRIRKRIQHFYLPTTKGLHLQEVTGIKTQHYKNFYQAKANLLRPTSSKDTPSKGYGHPKSNTTKIQCKDANISKPPWLNDQSKRTH